MRKSKLGDLVLQVSGVRHGYRLLDRPQNPAALCETLSTRFARRERQDIACVRAMLRFAEHDGCLTRHLLDYFGEKRGDCGHCIRCAGIAGQPPPPARYTPPGRTEAE